MSKSLVLLKDDRLMVDKSQKLVKKVHYMGWSTILFQNKISKKESVIF